MFDSIKKQIHNIIMHECDDIIVELMQKKLDIKVYKEVDDIVFTVSFSGKLIREDRVTIK
jgi:hypothetical protein